MLFEALVHYVKGHLAPLTVQLGIICLSKAFCLYGLALLWPDVVKRQRKYSSEFACP